MSVQEEVCGSQTFRYSFPVDRPNRQHETSISAYFRLELLWAIACWYTLLPYPSVLFSLLISIYNSQVCVTYGFYSCAIYLFFQIIKPKITLELAQAACHLDKSSIIASLVNHHLAVETVCMLLSFISCLLWQFLGEWGLSRELQ